MYDTETGPLAWAVRGSLFFKLASVHSTWDLNCISFYSFPCSCTFPEMQLTLNSIMRWTLWHKTIANYFWEWEHGNIRNSRNKLCVHPTVQWSYGWSFISPTLHLCVPLISKNLTFVVKPVRNCASTDFLGNKLNLVGEIYSYSSSQWVFSYFPTVSWIKTFQQRTNHLCIFSV